MAVDQSLLVAELPCGATVSIENSGQLDSTPEHAALMVAVKAHQARCARCQASPPGAGGIVISRRPSSLP